MILTSKYAAGDLVKVTLVGRVHPPNGIKSSKSTKTHSFPSSYTIKSVLLTGEKGDVCQSPETVQANVYSPDAVF